MAANNADTRQVRRGGDAAVALDDFIAQLRQDGFRLGAVVEEVHRNTVSGCSAVDAGLIK